MKKLGFTLPEVLVSIAIFVLIGLAVSSFGRDIFFINSGLQNNLSAQLDGRKILKRFVTELRSASPSSLGSYPIEQAATSSFVFYSNIDTDSYKERLRYYLSGKTLYRGVIKPSGNPLTYSSASEKVEIIIRDVANSTSTPIFEYFDDNFTGTSSPLTYPISIADIRLVRATVVIDKDSNRPPGPITITTQGTPRNLKDNF